MKNRIEYIDFVKGIIIFLMVMFHINYVDFIKPITPLIYAFHIPIFLFFSGYFLNTNKKIGIRLYQIFRSLLIPYLLFELLYIISLYIAGLLGFSFQNNISNINASILLYKILLNPIGAYWYLHTLIICMIISYIIDYYVENQIIRIIIIGLLCFSLSHMIDGLKFENCLFFIIGYYYQKYRINIPLSIFSILPFLLIGMITFDNIKRGSIESYGLVMFLISFLGWIFTRNSSLLFFRIISYIGKNTLIIVLIHPIFLNLFKVFYKKFLIIDSTGFIYIVIITTVTIISSLICSIILDRLNISKILFGKEIYVPFQGRTVISNA